MTFSQNTKVVSVLLLFFFIGVIALSLRGFNGNFDNRNRAAATLATAEIFPKVETFNVGDVKTFDVKITFTGGSASEKIDYLKLKINFPTEFFEVPANNYVLTYFPNQGNLERILRVDGPVVANQGGMIIVETGAKSPGSGPGTDSPITVAEFKLKALKNTTSAQNLTVTLDQLVNNSSNSISMGTSTPTTVTIGGGSGSTPTPGTCDRSHGDANCDGVVDHLDYTIWNNEYTGMVATTLADFIIDGQVNLIDFELWRRNASNY